MTTPPGSVHQIEHEGVKFTATHTGNDQSGWPVIDVVGHEVDAMARSDDYRFTISGESINPRDIAAVTAQLERRWAIVLDGVGIGAGR